MADPVPYNIKDILRERVVEADQLHKSLDDRYYTEVREELAESAAKAAINNIPEAYRYQAFFQTAVHEATQIALGLKPLPEQEGEQ